MRDDFNAVTMPCHSVPTSPAMVRSTSQRAQPVTPQRLQGQRPQHRYSSSQSFYRSPTTPSSPYTPLSLRSFASSGSGGSSTLTTPDHPRGVNVKRPFVSPGVARGTSGGMEKDHSLADLAENWRSRASENGIKVSSVLECPRFGDDTVSETTHSDINDSSFISTEEALLAPFVTAHKRAEPQRPRAHSHVLPPTSRILASPTAFKNPSRAYNQPSSPLVSRRLNHSQHALVMSTPPQNRQLSRQLKFKGSFTDPPQPRRRDRDEPLRTPSQNYNKSLNVGLGHDTSFDLFDIDENDFEYDLDDKLANSHDSLMELNFHPDPNVSHNNSAYPFPDYAPPLLPSYQQPYPSPHSIPPFADPFQGRHALTNIPESVEHYFHTQKFRPTNIYAGPGSHPMQHLQAPSAMGPIRPPTHPLNGYVGNPVWVPLPAISSASSAAHINLLGDQKDTKPKQIGTAQEKSAIGCSVCLAPKPRTLAILAPCSHPLCSACLTSALNIVGEKDMECAVCKGKVADFRLVAGEGNKTPEPTKEGDSMNERKSLSWEDQEGRSFMDPLFSSPKSGTNVEFGQEGLESAFEFGLGLEDIRASTPKVRDERGEDEMKQGNVDRETIQIPKDRGRGKKKGEENIVLRIDNVPWDITPPQIEKWLQQPLERVHVLLDKKGKTMSHAYVEVGDVDVAGKILRGEVRDDGSPKSGTQPAGKPRERGSVLGKGRRARGVTVTRSSQEELMADLFPNWRGSFDASRPSLAGLDSGRVVATLESGLIGESEVAALLHLIREPDSRFLKSPSLPFHSLISILTKFPTDVDSRVFWSSSVRDLLYDVTYAAAQMLLSRVDNVAPSVTGESEYNMNLVLAYASAALDCQAFTTRQLSKFTELLKSNSIELPTPSIDTASSDPSSSPISTNDELETPDSRDMASHVYAAEEVGWEPSAGTEVVAELAKEFGVEAQLVQALAQRLVALH